MIKSKLKFKSDSVLSQRDDRILVEIVSYFLKIKTRNSATKSVRLLTRKTNNFTLYFHYLQSERTPDTLLAQHLLIKRLSFPKK